MIKLEHVVLASPEQMEFIIEGMRNPMNSWDKSDTDFNNPGHWQFGNGDVDKVLFPRLGPNDLKLMNQLSSAGTDHRKYMRMMPVYVRITAPLYFWKEFDTYKVGTVANSCSTMHKIQAKEFTVQDFSVDHLLYFDDLTEEEEMKYFEIPFDVLYDTIKCLNSYREKWLECDKALKSNSLYGINPEQTRKEITEKQKQYWWQMIQLLPSSYNQTRNIMLNYEVLANMYNSRKNHKLDEWREFCSWIETLPYKELIIGEIKNVV